MKFKHETVGKRPRYFKVPFQIEMKMGAHLEFISLVDGKREVVHKVDYYAALS